jgi:hypothetical protein
LGGVQKFDGKGLEASVTTCMKVGIRKVSAAGPMTNGGTKPTRLNKGKKMEFMVGTLVLAFGANVDEHVHVRHPTKGDVLGIVKEHDRHRNAVIV